MKKSLLFLALFLGTLNLIGQVVPSSCTAPDSIVAKYIDDADRLTLQKIFQQNLSYKDSVQIPEIHVDSILKALLSVYNALSIPECDTVVRLLDLHTFPNYSLNIISIAANPDLPWMIQLSTGIIPTGNQAVDSLVSVYNLSFDKYLNYGNNTPYDAVWFKSEQNLNLEALSAIFEKIPGVDHANPTGIIGDGFNIYASIFSNYIQLKYYYGWDDCYSGCKGKRYWIFNVYYDCSVEFVESYGNTISYVGINNLEKPDISISPNPFKDFIHISGISLPFHYSIVNLFGQKIISGRTKNQTIDDLNNIESGFYILSIKTENQTNTFRIFKE